MEEVTMKEFRTKSGEVLTEEDIERIADEVESDAPVVFTGIRLVGRPSLNGDGVSPRLSFRVPRDLYDGAMERAIEDETTVSEVTRKALEEYLAE
jgi:hypothetical protein